jgi:hypothetical protein
MAEHEYMYQRYLIEGEYCDSCKGIPWERMFSEAFEQYHFKRQGFFESSDYSLPNIKALIDERGHQPTCPLCQVFLIVLTTTCGDGTSQVFDEPTMSLATRHPYPTRYSDIFTIPLVGLRLEWNKGNPIDGSQAYRRAFCNLELAKGEPT